jgi:hypothetical protein
LLLKSNTVNITKETIRFIIEAVRAIVFIRLILKLDNSYELYADIAKIAIKGINNKKISNIIRTKRSK